MDQHHFSINDLSFQFGSHSILSKFCLQISPGDLVWIQGDNGIGKTTFLKLLYGFLSPSSGRVQRSLKPDEMAWVDSESNGLFYDLSAVENLTVWNKKQWSHINLGDLAIEWGFSNWNLSKDLPVSYFSTGMKRRLALMRLCSSLAKSWLVDEPMLGLDQKSAAVFLKKLTEHLNRGGSCILSSHEDRGLTEILNLKKIVLSNQRVNHHA